MLFESILIVFRCFSAEYDTNMFESESSICNGYQ